MVKYLRCMVYFLEQVRMKYTDKNLKHTCSSYEFWKFQICTL